MTYDFLQHYWCFLVSLLGALLVFLLFVQGANSMVRSLGYTDEGRRLIINSTGRKWEFTFTTLVTFGGAFFASFPLFYSTSFGGAYWLWMIILFTFVVQAVSYEFHQRIIRTATPWWCSRNILRGLQLYCRQREPGRHWCHHASHQPMGQRFSRSRRPAQPLGVGVRTGRHVPGTRVGHPLYY